VSFRHQSGDLFQWRKKNASNLVELGIPETIVEDHHRFILAVQNSDDRELGWSADWVADGNTSTLLDLLSEQFTGVGWDLVGELERRVGKTNGQAIDA